MRKGMSGADELEAYEKMWANHPNNPKNRGGTMKANVTFEFDSEDIHPTGFTKDMDVFVSYFPEEHSEHYERLLYGKITYLKTFEAPNDEAVVLERPTRAKTTAPSDYVSDKDPEAESYNPSMDKIIQNEYLARIEKSLSGSTDLRGVMMAHSRLQAGTNRRLTGLYRLIFGSAVVIIGLHIVDIICKHVGF